MPKERKLVLAGLVAAGILLSTPLPVLAQPPLDMAFDGDAVAVRGLEPGAEIVYFSVSRAVRAFVPRNERQNLRLVDEDLDGEVRIPLEVPVPPKFVALAVELAGGRFDVLTPEGSPVREIAFPAHSLGRGPGNRLDRLEDSRDYVELLLVRPGVGAWTLMTGDGTPSDESPPSDGLVRTSVGSMRPVGESGGPPTEYERDDLLFRVAPRAGMEYYVTRIVR